MPIHFSDGVLFYVFAAICIAAGFFFANILSMRERLIRIETKLNIIFSVVGDGRDELRGKFFGKK